MTVSSQRSDPSARAASPRLVVCDDEHAAAEIVARWFAEAIEKNPSIVLGLATGGTPVGVYRNLIDRHRRDGLDFANVTSFNLDEYVGLGPDHPQSFRYFMQTHLFDHINIDPNRTFVPDGLAKDLDAHVAAYEDWIKQASGIELQLLGIGRNGHIAFNEPGSPVNSRTRVVDLTEETIRANARFFGSVDAVPRKAITMGIGTILDSKRIVLMATGPEKAEAIRRAIEEPSNDQCPASWLQQHSDATFVIDHAAASKLTR